MYKKNNMDILWL